MALRTVYTFPTDELPEIEEVGGKGLSLIKSSKEKLPVPPGFVLTSYFFTPWFEQLQHSEEWGAFKKANPENLRDACDKVKAFAETVNFSDDQWSDVKRAFTRFPREALFAVRSSSPEEDLEGTSFAGGYETVLGVPQKNIEAAARRCFASCLDYRIVTYKKEHHFDIYTPRIAAVVQKQIASEIAGVGFSINPLTNDFDEAVITSNFGLGETVVSGVITPDTYIADKSAFSIKERVMGKKEKSVWLLPEGGTEERIATGGPGSGGNRYSLSDKRVLEVAQLIFKVEKLNERPMDIEWAYEKSTLFLLQARPITAFQPLPPILVTQPRHRRRLYLDVTASVQAIFEPLTVMGSAMLEKVFAKVSRHVLGRTLNNVDDFLAVVAGGRLYANVSNAFGMLGKLGLIEKLVLVDPIAASTIASVDERRYKNASPMPKLMLSAMKKIPSAAAAALNARIQPERVYREFELRFNKFKNTLKDIDNRELPLDQHIEAILDELVKFIFPHLLVAIFTGFAAKAKILKIANESGFEEEAEHLVKSLPNNVTVQMGLDLYDLSRQLPARMEAEQLVEKLQKRSLPESFLSLWDEFIARYGHRGPKELDIGSARYEDDFSFLANQIVALYSIPAEDSPRQRYEESVRQRIQAYQYVKRELARLSWMDAARFESRYRVMLAFGGLRETPKFCVILALNYIRRRLRSEGELLAGEGRLERMKDVFDIALNELLTGLADQSLNLRALVEEHRTERARLKLETMPHIFDSRGRIIRPPRAKVKEGEIAGTPISVGKVSGKARVLHSPTEKKLNPGDVLVARATDPGWTPLFAVAGGVVLEIGGILQHGALVAREYGLPCVAGVENATVLLKDDMLIEVDGTSGIVRVLSQ